MTIIAECCTNWQDLSEAREMIRVAKEAGAGLVKFQLFNAEDDKGKPHYQWVKAHELTFEQAKELFDYGGSLGMETWFSIFDPKFIQWGEMIGVHRYKLAAGCDTWPIYEALRSTGKEIVVSSRNGIPNVPEEHADEWDDICPRVKWLFCPPGYPAQSFKVPEFEGISAAYDGFSDHTIGIDTAKIALARGARIVEKHFVLEHNEVFPDDAWSMTPEELRELVRFEAVCKEAL